jgi:HK97 family phage prohead protease
MTLMTKHGTPMLELKAIQDDGLFAGYGSIFGNQDSHGEVVMPGAFAKSLADHRRKGTRPKLFWQHRMDEPIGKWTDFSEDGKGLYMEGRLNMDVQRGREAHALLKAGDIDGLSIGYRVISAEPDDKAKVIRLKELTLLEVSVVSLGSNDKALVDEVKTWMEGETPSVREFEKWLRDAGDFSKSKAVAMAAACAPHLRGDPEGKADELAEFLLALRA